MFGRFTAKCRGSGRLEPAPPATGGAEVELYRTLNSDASGLAARSFTGANDLDEDRSIFLYLALGFQRFR